jgi:hypothetical protein
MNFDAGGGPHAPYFSFAKSNQKHSLCRAWMHKCRDAMDGVERPGRHPSGSLRSSRKTAQKELAALRLKHLFA